MLARWWTVDPIELAELVTPPPAEARADLSNRTWTGYWHVNVGVHADEHVGRNWEDLPLVSQGWLINGDDTDNAEYIVGIEWISARDASNAVRPSGVALRGTAVRIYGQDRAAELVAAFGVSAQTSE